MCGYIMIDVLAMSFAILAVIKVFVDSVRVMSKWNLHAMCLRFSVGLPSLQAAGGKSVSFLLCLPLAGLFARCAPPKALELYHAFAVAPVMQQEIISRQRTRQCICLIVQINPVCMCFLVDLCCSRGSHNHA